MAHGGLSFVDGGSLINNCHLPPSTYIQHTVRDKHTPPSLSLARIFS